MLSSTTNRRWLPTLFTLIVLGGVAHAFIPAPRTVSHHGLWRQDACQQYQHTVTRTASTARTTRMNLSVASTSTAKVLLSPLVISKVLPVLTGCGALIYYHTELQRRESAPTNELTWRSSQADTREAWSKHVRDTEGWLYAIQTLRNAITANTFLATTVLSLLTVITGKLWSTITKTATTAGATGGINSIIKAFPDYYYPRIQFTAVALSFLRSAYEFLQSARLMTHAGFMFPVDKDGIKVDSILRKSSMAQWLGLRWLYIGGTMLVWTVGGEVPFLVTSLMMVRFFRNIDRAPE